MKNASNFNLNRSLIAVAVSMAISPFCAQLAVAQEDKSLLKLEEIVVTASRREASTQDIAVAVSAVSGDKMARLNITNPRQLSGLAPSLHVDQGLGEGQTHVSIRGQTGTSFGLEANSPVGIYIDDVNQPYQFGIATQIYDLERIEVLRGPQGTLFGKNTTAGSLNYFTKVPTNENEGYITLDFGSGDFNRRSIDGAANWAVSDNLAIRLSMRAESRDDYIKNLYTGKATDTGRQVDDFGELDNLNARLQFAWAPLDNTDVNLKLFMLDSEGDAPVYTTTEYAQSAATVCTPPFNYYKCINPSGPGTAPSPISTNPRETYSNIEGGEEASNGGFTFRVNHAVGNYDLVSITNYQEGDYYIGNNDDGILGDFFHSRQHADYKQHSQEFRLATPTDGSLSGIFGVFYQNNESYTVQGNLSSTLDLLYPDDPAALYYEWANGTIATIENATTAVFASGTYEFNDKLELTAGVRYTREKQNVDFNKVYIDANFLSFPFATGILDDVHFDFVNKIAPLAGASTRFKDQATWTKTTWDIALNYHPNDNTLLYVKTGTGFRSGAFNDAPSNHKEGYWELKPEDVISYEIGAKTDWLDNRLRANLSAYLLDYTDMQVQAANTTGPGLTYSNAGESEIKGIEIEVDALPMEGLILSASLGYTSAEYKIFDTLLDASSSTPTPISLAGNPLPHAPEVTSNLMAYYTFPVNDNLNIGLMGNVSYRSEIYFNQFKESAVGDESQAIGDLAISLYPASDEWEVSVYVNNVTDELVKAFNFDLTTHIPTIYAPMRTYGMKFTYNL